MRLIARFLDFFFHHLYHRLAFAYDTVAAIVSFGQWNEWTRETLPFIQGTRLLELGHGTGHLQRTFLDLGLFAVGLEESSQMGHLARQHIIRAGHAQPNLTRGIGQSLPFCDDTFDSIAATFPAPYIAEAQTLSEARRVLRNGGRLIVLPAACPRNRLLRWLYRITGESPAEGVDVVKEKWSLPFARAGFKTEAQTIDVKSGMLLLIIATK